MVGKRGAGTVIFAVILALVGSGLVFAGFEWAAMEHTIEERQVTENGTVTDTEVWQLPDGNWTYRIDYEYTHDQRGEIERLGIEHQYPGEMAGEQQYSHFHRGGKHDTEDEARSALNNKLGEDPSMVVVWVDPFNPGEGALSDALTNGPRIVQYIGSVILAIGLLILIRMARRIST